MLGAQIEQSLRSLRTEAIEHLRENLAALQLELGDADDMRGRGVIAAVSPGPVPLERAGR